MKAPTFAAVGACPDREATDQWLFLAQHVGLPTRLLDWTEGALIGLYFAVRAGDSVQVEPAAVVWMLNPIGLNRACATPNLSPGDQFPLTWHDPEKGPKNIGFENIAGAWEGDTRGTKLPVAVQPTNIHPRMSVQRSCFTVHGIDKASLADQVPQLLRRYDIEPKHREAIQADLRLLGISHLTLWPELDGLARELRELY
jgi:hypothetical protein